MVMPWLTALLLILAAVGALVALLRSGPQPRRAARGRQEAPRRLANSMSLLALPQVRARIRRRRWLHVGLAVMAVCALVAAAGIAGRPVREVERNEDLANRDIVLCLDVSTSMVTIDSSVLNTFSEMVDTFDGERVGLVAWNSSAQTIVPLTDDYDLLSRKMDELAEVLDIDPNNVTYEEMEAYDEALGGTISVELQASSLAGDGLASCAMAFDQQGLERSRSIIYATDNQVIDPDSKQIYALPDAVSQLSERKIRLFSIYGSDPDMDSQWETELTPPEAREQLKSLTEEAGGRFYDVESSGTGGKIVEQLEASQVAEMGGATEVRNTDVPERLGIALLIITLVYVGLTVWRRA
ncbi:VWA domain-containing protein [Actinomyces slackii]|uniref:VWFA domain-containing protein n=1 Tax=Actinomyces slackii TaxID=52774 RepID=A0A3S4WG89_9ACTO|nr:VWA domain-containing protein [Actinomyces slackii]VEG74212.1 Uncharacterised protein [Actinomyces slackii]